MINSMAAVVYTAPEEMTYVPEYRPTQQDTILTPHVAEAARLFKSTVDAVLNNLEKTAVELSHKTGSYVILKSSSSIISSPSRHIYYYKGGNPGMACAGSGDVLSGCIAALLPRLAPLDAVKTGVYLHGHAGHRAVQFLGMESVSASDIIDQLPAAWHDLSHVTHKNNALYTIL